ncbi:MAG: disulfide reductase [Candidatus Lokiarchaeota archaeon]|nr:disulfide reductase [Candidatus Lokiarchaeota archaeon]
MTASNDTSKMANFEGSPLEKYREMMQRCIRCSLCKWIPQIQIKSEKYSSICPSIDEYNFHSYSGGGRIIVGLALLEGKMPVNGKLLEVIYSCTLCGGCDIACKYLNNLEPLEVIQEIREELIKRGHGPLPNQKKYSELTLELNNPYGEPDENRYNCLPESIELTPDAEIGYFIGCTSSYRRKEIAASTARVFNKLDIEFQLLDPEICCGSPLYRVGDLENTKELMNKNISRIKECGIKTVVTSCAGCYAMFKAEYPRLLGKELPFKVLHTAELIEDLIDKGEIKFTKELPLTVTYHDPCHLGRGSEPYEEWKGKMVEVVPMLELPIPPKPKRQGTNGVYDAPRNVLKNIPGIKFVEMERIKEYSYCCGAGGGVKAQFPEFAINTAKIRVEEAIDTCAKTFISCCPFCKTNLVDGINALGSDMEFYDLIELVEMALEENE